MRWQHDRFPVLSATSVTASASVRAKASRQDRDRNSDHVIGELVRYVLDNADLFRSNTEDGRTVDEYSSCDPHVISVALQHQQLRAEVCCHYTSLFARCVDSIPSRAIHGNEPCGPLQTFVGGPSHHYVLTKMLHFLCTQRQISSSSSSLCLLKRADKTQQ